MRIAELLQSLADAQVQYVLVGGLAVQLHGFLRATFDIDLALAMSDENLLRFINVAKDYGLKPGKKSNAERTRMPETGIHPIISIPQDVMLARLAQAEQMREFFIQMWQQNPALAAQAGPQVRELLAVPPAPTFTSEI